MGSWVWDRLGIRGLASWLFPRFKHLGQPAAVPGPGDTEPQSPSCPSAATYPPPPKKHWEWPGAVLASGLRFRLTWVSVTFQLGDLGLIPNLLASVSSPVKWAKYSICQNKDEMRTCGTSVNSGMFVFNKYLLRVYYGPGTELIALHIMISFNSSTLLLTTFYKGGN